MIGSLLLHCQMRLLRLIYRQSCKYAISCIFHPVTASAMSRFQVEEIKLWKLRRSLSLPRLALNFYFLTQRSFNMMKFNRSIFMECERHFPLLRKHDILRNCLENSIN
jgi:hypothetical protein